MNRFAPTQPRTKRRAPTVRPQPPGRCEFGVSFYGLTAFSWDFAREVGGYLDAIRCTRPRVWLSWAPAGDASVLRQDGTVSRAGLALLRRYMDAFPEQRLHLTYQPNWHTGAGVPQFRVLASIAQIHRELRGGPAYTVDPWNELSTFGDVRLAAAISREIRDADPRAKIGPSSAGSLAAQGATWGAYSAAQGVIDFLPSHTPRHDATQGEAADPWFRALRSLTAEHGAATLPLWNDEPFRAGDQDAGGGAQDPTLLDYEQDAEGASRWCAVHVLHIQGLFGPAWLRFVTPTERRALPMVASWLGLRGAAEAHEIARERIFPGLAP